MGAVLLWGEISGVKLPIIVVGVKIGGSTLMGMICSNFIEGVKIGGGAIVHPFSKCTCSQEGNAQGIDNFPNFKIQIFLNVSKFYKPNK